MTTYRGIVCHQTENFREVLTPVLQDIDPEFVIEIGTAYGGTTLFVLDTLPKAKVVTFEIDVTKPNSHLKWYRNCVLYLGDVWTRNTFNPVARHYLSLPRKKLILIDGGNKLDEFTKVAPYLRRGDIVGVHDFCIDKETFETEYLGTVWHWLEITHSELSTVCNKYKLSPVFPSTHQAMWGFYRKEA